MNKQPEAQPGALMRLETDERGRVRAVPSSDTYQELTGHAGQGERMEPPAPTQEHQERHQERERGVWRIWRQTDAEPGTAPAFEQLDRATWFDELAGDTDACAKAYGALMRWIPSTEKGFPGCHLKRTPGATALQLIHHSLPWGKGQKRPYEYPLLDAKLSRLIAANTPPHRQEHTAREGLIIERLSMYDARVSYLAFLRHLPIIPAEGVTHDEGAYEPYRAGKYRVAVTVPAGWHHIGLAHRKRPAGDGWEWPVTPGEEWECWLDESELRLLSAHGWPFTVRERIVFAGPKAPGNDPLREYAERLSAEIERVDALAPHTPALNAYRAALRAIAIHPVGLWQKQSNTRELDVPDVWDATQLAELADIAGIELSSSLILPNPDNTSAHIEGVAALSAYQAHWRRSEWSSTILARERVTVAKRALTLPAPSVLALDGDAVYLGDMAPDRAPLCEPAWKDTGKVGAYRAKLDRTYPRGRVVPAMLGGLRALAATPAKGQTGQKGA